MQTLTVTSEQAGMRIDKFLAIALELTRREVLLVLEHKCISLNNQKLTLKSKGKLLIEKDLLTISNYSDILSTTILPNPQLDLDILSTGDDYLVVNKTAGMPVMPLKPEETDTVLNAVTAHYPELQGVGEGGLRSGVVHRLDTDTSGTLIIATEEKRWQSLRNAFKEHKTTKRYKAIVHSKLNGKGQEQMNLVIAQHKPAKVRVVTKAMTNNGQSNSSERTCDLSWQTLENFGDAATLVEIELGTGFLHQIRVMFAHMGHPVIGDKLYGNNFRLEKHVSPKRQMLHACYLKLLDIEVESPDPEDFSKLLKILRS